MPFTEHEIWLQRKTPYWTELLIGLLAALSVFPFLLYLFLLPAKEAGPEMQTAWYLLAVPGWLRSYGGYSIVGLAAVLPLYFFSKRRLAGTLRFDESFVYLESAKGSRSISRETIRGVLVNEVRRIGGRESHEVEVLLRGRQQLLASFRVAGTEAAEAIVQELAKREGISFQFFNGLAVQDFDDEA